MNWEAIGAVGEIVGAAAVVVTLIYVAVQVRQNTRSMDESRELALAQAYENRSQAAAQHFIQMRDSPYFKETSLILAPDASESEVNEQRKKTYLRWWMNTNDNLHYQHQKGFLDQEYYDNTFVVNVKLAAPKWRSVGIVEYRPSFAAEVDRILAETD
jgi:hypothetical protein